MVRANRPAEMRLMTQVVSRRPGEDGAVKPSSSFARCSSFCAIEKSVLCLSFGALSLSADAFIGDLAQKFCILFQERPIRSMLFPSTCFVIILSRLGQDGICFNRLDLIRPAPAAAIYPSQLLRQPKKQKSPAFDRGFRRSSAPQTLRLRLLRSGHLLPKS